MSVDPANGAQVDNNTIQPEAQMRSLVHTAPHPLRQHEVVDVTPEEIPHLLDYWDVILKRRWVVLSCLLVVFSTVTIGTLKQKPVYEGEVLIEISPEPPQVLNFREILQVDSQDVESYRETQYVILRSRTLAERVVQDLHLYRLPEFYRRRALRGLLERDPATFPPSSDQAPVDFAAEYYRNAVRHMQDLVEVRPIRRSNLLQVSAYTEDPQLAARVANQLATDYIAQNLQVKWDETLKASEWLSTQLVGVKAKLEKAEDALQAYAQANSILFVEDKQNIASAGLKQLQEEFIRGQAERIQKESVAALVRSDEVRDLPGFLNNQLIQGLELRLAELERDYVQLTAVAKPDFPKAAQLKRQIDKLRADLQREKASLTQNILDEYRSAQIRESNLVQAIEAAKKEVNDLAEKSIHYNILKREVDTSRQLYDGLLQRMKEAQVSAGLKASNIRVVDPAETPKRPVRPRVVLNMALGLVLGLGLGIGIAFLQEYLDNTLKTPDEVEQLLRLPSLGVVPVFTLNGAGKATAGELQLSYEQPTSGTQAIQGTPAVLEAFRSLRTSILLSADPVPKILLVTSALPGEGKTTTVINLGFTLASLGSKVVIVDCDMRRPACHRLAGVENKPGFVQCLTGHVELAEAVLPVPGVPNLSVIPCGPIPPNPAEVLSSPIAAQLLRRLQAEFEYVLVDSPPLLSVSDSRILSTMTDATVLVARAYSTPREMVRRARSLLLGAGARILGVALNGINLARDGYSYYKYYSRYGYGYGYGPEAGTGSEQGSESRVSPEEPS